MCSLTLYITSWNVEMMFQETLCPNSSEISSATAMEQVWSPVGLALLCLLLYPPQPPLAHVEVRDSEICDPCGDSINLKGIPENSSAPSPAPAVLSCGLVSHLNGHHTIKMSESNQSVYGF